MFNIFGRSFKIGEFETVEKRDVYRFNGPRFLIVDPYDYYPDISKTSIKDMRFCIRDMVMYEDEIEELFVHNVFTEKDAWEEAKGKDRKQTLSDFEERRLKSYDRHIKDVASIKSYLVTEYVEDDRLIYVVNNKFCVRNSDNPNWHKQKHFIDAKSLVFPHRYYPRGLSWAVNDFQNAINDTFNQKADNVHYLLNSMMAVVEDEIIYMSDLKPEPGRRMRVRNDASKAIQPVRHENVTQDAYAQQSELMEMGQNASGIFDIIKGQMSRKETATVGSILASAASTRLQLAIRRMAKTSLVRMFMLMVELNRQYLTDAKAIEIIGEEDAQGLPKFRNITRYDMPQGFLNYIPQVNLQQKKEIEAKKALDAYNLFYNKPEFNQYGLAEMASKRSIDFHTKTPILVSKDDYTKRMDRMARQQEAMELKGMKEEPVVPPPDSDLAGGFRGPKEAPVRQQALSPEAMRDKVKEQGELLSEEFRNE